ncbi:hypothetical protein HYW35_01590 [Candidatus Saccharibacteria bacterium]|nr:hypothetical protein [Candidatus Saccharibacteria bacterium]
MKSFEDMRNGHGYCIIAPMTGLDEHPGFFPVDAQNVMDLVVANGSCLIEASVGAGKTHLVSDIARLARNDALEMPTLTLKAQISGGSRAGASNATSVLNHFAEAVGNQGLIIVDNVDYYGYSGSDGRRQYSRALAHSEVAKHLSVVIRDTSAPHVCATTHDDIWRANHWLYPLRGEDNVTPSAQSLLDSFSSRYNFSGKINAQTAEKVLKPKFGDSARELVNVLSLQGLLSFLVARRLDPEGVRQTGLLGEVERIQQETQGRVLGNRVLPKT